MYELVKVSENTFYMDCPSKVGIYRINESDVALIDSGSDKDTAKKVKRILDENGWKLKVIYNTHSHADHIGGNQYLQNQTGCKIFAFGKEKAITQFPVFEPDMLYGGFSLSELHNKFFMAKECVVEDLTENSLADGLETVNLSGHCYDMVGFKTKDNVIFVADSLSSRETLEKYKVTFIYDVKEYIETLEKLKTMQADIFVPSHAEQTDNIKELAQINIDKTYETSEIIQKLLSSPKTFDDLLKGVFDIYNLDMNLGQRMLVGSTIKSYLTYLKNENRADYYFKNNQMLWIKKDF